MPVANLIELRDSSKNELYSLKEDDFVTIPELEFKITKYAFQFEWNTDWYDTKLIIQGLGQEYYLPTSSEWGKASKYFKLSYEGEFTDSILAYPDRNGEYNYGLQIPGMPRKGTVPLLIEKSKLEKHGKYRIIVDGKFREIANVPSQSGYIKEYDENLGITISIGKYPIEEFDGAVHTFNQQDNGWGHLDGYDEGLFSIVRGGIESHGSEDGRKFNIIIASPSLSRNHVHTLERAFRVCKSI